MATIAFIGTGGTISNAGTGATDYLNYLDIGRVLDTETLLSMHPRIQELATIRPIPFAQLRSKQLTTHDWFRLAHVVQRTADQPDVAGVVIGHGTGLLEETAYFLQLVLNTRKPVVLVGAQRPPRTVASDAELNLMDAVRVAASEQCSGLGVLVVMNRTIHSARDVSKRANHDLAAMASPVSHELGVLGADGKIRLRRAPAGRHTTNSEFGLAQFAGPKSLPRVDVVYGHAQADGTAVEAFVAKGARGIVAIGFPPGTNPPGIDAALDAAADSGVAVVQASRGWDEPAVMLRGSLRDRGFVANADLTPQHARILLQLCLAKGFDTAEIRRAFSEY